MLVGHSLDHDLIVLQLVHERVVDTALLYDTSTAYAYKSKLRDLASRHLQQVIQIAGAAHDPVEDARAAMALAQLHRIETYDNSAQGGTAPENSLIQLLMDNGVPVAAYGSPAFARLAATHGAPTHVAPTAADVAEALQRRGGLNNCSNNSNVTGDARLSTESGDTTSTTRDGLPSNSNSSNTTRGVQPSLLLVATDAVDTAMRAVPLETLPPAACGDAEHAWTSKAGDADRVQQTTRTAIAAAAERRRTALAEVRALQSTVRTALAARPGAHLLVLLGLGGFTWKKWGRGFVSYR